VLGKSGTFGVVNQLQGVTRSYPHDRLSYQTLIRWSEDLTFSHLVALLNLINRSYLKRRSVYVSAFWNGPLGTQAHPALRTTWP